MSEKFKITYEERAERAEAALREIGEYSEKSYWVLRGWLDSRPDCSEWVHGDDWPAFPFLNVAGIVMSVLDPSPARVEEAKES